MTRWRLALVASLLLHGLLVLACVRLPGAGRSGPAVETPVPPDPGLFESPGPGEPIAFLVPRPRQPRPVPKIAGPGDESIEIEQRLPPQPPSTSPPPEPPRPAASPGSPGAGGSGNGSVTTAFFSIPTRGARVVFVIDRSASMGMNQALN